MVLYAIMVFKQCFLSFFLKIQYNKSSVRLLLHSKCSCTSTHTSCYAAGCSLANPHVRHATLLDALLQVHTYVMLCCWMFSWTSTHTSCYAAGYSLALPHIRHSTLLDVLLHFQCPEQPRPTLCLKPKKELFGETLGEQKCIFVLVKH